MGGGHGPVSPGRHPGRGAPSNPIAGVFNVPKTRKERKTTERKSLQSFDMNLPWYEYGLWFAAIVAKAVLFWKCLSIRKLAFLQAFTVYGLIYELLSLFMFFQHPASYIQFLWILDFIKYFIYSLLAVQLATLKESKVIAFNSFMILCTAIFVFISNANLTNTEPLLRIMRFIDGCCLGAIFLTLVQKMDILYKRIAIGLGILLSSEFICGFIQAYDHWKHWNFVRPMYALSFLVSLIAMILLVKGGTTSNFPFVLADRLYHIFAVPTHAVADPVVQQQHSPYPELYLP